jgi:hypothetical protein
MFSVHTVHTQFTLLPTVTNCYTVLLTHNSLCILCEARQELSAARAFSTELARSPDTHFGPEPGQARLTRVSHDSPRRGSPLPPLPISALSSQP